jgi:hypothetical protein
MTMTSTFRRLIALPVLLAVAALTGCASPLTHQDMTPAPVQVAKHRPDSVTVAAVPRAGADAESTALVTAELRTAISDAITASQAFASVKTDGGDYQLTAQVFSEKHPLFGVSFTSNLTMGWTLKRSAGGATVWQEEIASEHTTGGLEAFVGAERVKMAIAGAIRSNIAKAMSRIAEQTF